MINEQSLFFSVLNRPVEAQNQTELRARGEQVVANYDQFLQIELDGAKSKRKHLEVAITSAKSTGISEAPGVQRQYENALKRLSAMQLSKTQADHAGETISWEAENKQNWEALLQQIVDFEDAGVKERSPEEAAFDEKIKEKEDAETKIATIASEQSELDKWKSQNSSSAEKLSELARYQELSDLFLTETKEVTETLAREIAEFNDKEGPYHDPSRLLGDFKEKSGSEGSTYARYTNLMDAAGKSRILEAFTERVDIYPGTQVKDYLIQLCVIQALGDEQPLRYATTYHKPRSPMFVR